MRGGALRPHTRSLRDGWQDVGGLVIPVTLGLVLQLEATSGITLNGGNVSAWADQSGAGNHYTQATAANQPAYTAGAGPRASQRALVFTAANLDFLSRASAPVGTDMTLFVVASTASTAASQASFSVGANSDGFSSCVAVTAGKRSLLLSGVADEPDGIATTAYEAWTLTSTNTGPAQAMRVNGVGQVLAPNNSAMQAPSATSFVGCRGGSTIMWGGSIFSVYLYSRVLSGAEIALVEGYISKLTGIF